MSDQKYLMSFNGQAQMKVVSPSKFSDKSGQKHPASFSSQDSLSEMPPEKKVKIDPARLAFEKQLRRQAAALVDSQTQITRLQCQLQAVEAREREARLLMETERRELRSRAERAQAQSSELAADLDRLRSERDQLEAELADGRSRLSACQLRCDQQRLAAQQRADLGSQRLSEELDAARRELAEVHARLLAAEAAREAAQQRLELEQAQAAARPASDGGLELERLRLELQTAQLRVKELENTIASNEEDARLGSLMKERLALFPQLEAENKAMKVELKSLRHMVDRTLVLEEQLAVLQQKADRFDQVQQQLEAARAQCSEAERQAAAWREAAGVDASSPAALAQTLRELRHSQLLLEEARGAARAEVSAMETKCKNLQDAVTELKAAQAEHEQSRLEGQVQLRKLQRKLTLVTMERDSCKRVLEAYESETTESLTSIERQRGEDLERQLSTYKQQVDALERQLQEAASSGKLVFGSADSEARAQLSALRSEHEQLQVHQRQLQEEKEGLEAQLEERALRGDYNPATTRVLSLRENPASAAASRRSGQLERLQQENAELRSRLEVLQDGTAASGGLSQDAAKEISALRSQLRASELRMRRLKEVFGRSTQEYRQAVSQLTGYKINADGRQLKLRSVYAPEHGQTLLFHRGDGDTIQLLETSFSAALSDLVEEHLYRQDSMPGFLAALTLRLLRDGPPAAPAPAQAAAPAAAADDDDPEIVELD